MVSRLHTVFKVADRSYFAIIKKEIHALAASANFSPGTIGEIDIIVAEMVSNLIKHGGGGQVLVKLVEEWGIQGIELLSIDSGVGMSDVSRMVTDGVSTKNTLGHGLGAMKRLAHVFQAYSQKSWGTVLLIRVFVEDLPRFKKPPIEEIRDLVIPKPGEEACGDGFFSTTSNEHIRVFLGDGLGHGPEAAAAVLKAGEAFLNCNETDPVEVIRYMDRAVKKTRGLVGTVATFDIQEKCWRICGVGNILTKLVTPGNFKNYMAYNGIIGLNVPNTLKAQQIEHEKGQQLIMCSDGIKSRWDIGLMPGILRYDLSILAGALLKDFARYTDDMSVATCKINL